MIAPEEDERQPRQRVARQRFKKSPYVRHPASYRQNLSEAERVPTITASREETWSSTATRRGWASQSSRTGSGSPYPGVRSSSTSDPARREQSDDLFVVLRPATSAKSRSSGASGGSTSLPVPLEHGCRWIVREQLGSGGRALLVELDREEGDRRVESGEDPRRADTSTRCRSRRRARARGRRPARAAAGRPRRCTSA